MREQWLSAGPLKVRYESGFLRYVRYDEAEIIRMIYFALRDENWGTYELFIENEDINRHEDHFTIRYVGYHRKGGQNIFKWKVFIEGGSAGTINFTIRGEALQDVLKNRAGLCVLHPIRGVNGQACEILHAGGTKAAYQFPDFIAPTNPFKDIKSMRWKSFDNWWQLNFEGDVFETEDQRNWTDASFKTFCTPLSKPFPVLLRQDDIIQQQVTFTPEQPIRIIEPKREVKQREHLTHWPLIGIGASTETNDLSEDAIKHLQELHLSHYRIDVDMQKRDWSAKLTIDCQNALRLNLPLEMVLTLSNDFVREFTLFENVFAPQKTPAKQLLLLSSDAPATRQSLVDFASVIRKTFPDLKVGAGTNFNFTELNRNRFDARSVDFISFSIHPQEHAFDNSSLIETLEAQVDVVLAAKKLYPCKDIHISPVTLRKRFNPYAIDPAYTSMPNEQKADPRQVQEFCAAWTLGSIKQLARAGASSVTYYQTLGRQGILQDELVYPVYFALKKVMLNRHGKFKITESPRPLEFDGIVFENGQHIGWTYSDSDFSGLQING
jgi:hypothetical protein